MVQPLHKNVQGLQRTVQPLQGNFSGVFQASNLVSNKPKYMHYYEEDSQTGVIKMYAEIGWWNTNASNFTALLEQMDAKYDNIKIRCHCYGGAVFEGNAIYNCILGLKATVTFIIEGVCMSMGTIIMLAANKIQAADNAIIMVHCPSGGAYGTAKDMYSAGKLLTMLEKNFTRRYTEKTGKPAGTVKAWFDGSDHYFDAEEAKALGLVDEVIPAVVKNVKQLDKPSGEAPADYGAMYNTYAALLQENPSAQQTNSTKTEIYMKKELIAKYGLKGVTESSSDTAVMEALEAHFSANASGTDARSQAEAVIASVEKITAKPFEASQRATLLGIGEKAGLEALQMTMAVMVPVAAIPEKEETPAGPAASTAAPSVHTMIKNSGNGNNQNAEDRKGWTWEDWQKKDPKGLAAMETSDFDRFNALYREEFGAALTK